MNDSGSEITVFAVNRHLTESVSVELDVRSFASAAGGILIIEEIEYTSDDLQAYNGPDESKNIVPHNVKKAKVGNGIISTTMANVSWNVIRLAVK